MEKKNEGVVTGTVGTTRELAFVMLRTGRLHMAEEMEQYYRTEAPVNKVALGYIKVDFESRKTTEVI